MHVVTGSRKFDHITPMLRQPHWLPIQQRIIFKLAVLTLKCRLPTWSMCVFLSRLSSAGGSCIWRETVILQHNRTTIGWQDFAVSSPMTSSSLPHELQTVHVELVPTKTYGRLIHSAASTSEDSSVRCCKMEVSISFQFMVCMSYLQYMCCHFID